MVNHFASLLYNKPASKIKGTTHNFSLAGGDEGKTLEGSEEGVSLITSDFFTTINIYSNLNTFIARDYTELRLPVELSSFYDLLFNSGASEYYSKFTLYNYLKAVASTTLADRVKDFDTRITYDLASVTEYFSTKRMSETRSSDPRFKLIVSGSGVADERSNASINDYVIMQEANTANVLAFSATQKEYYAPGKPPSKRPAGMSVPITLNPDNKTLSQLIELPGTGFTVSITGPMLATIPSEWDAATSYKKGDNVLYGVKTYTSKTTHVNSTTPELDSTNWLEYKLVDFLTAGNKIWSFSTNIPPKFDLIGKIKEIDSRDYVVDNMLSFHKDGCDVNHENIWRQHYNDVYRFAGLLLAYVERVNLVCQRRLT
jgi:hypothetical protein